MRSTCILRAKDFSYLPFATSVCKMKSREFVKNGEEVRFVWLPLIATSVLPRFLYYRGCTET